VFTSQAVHVALPVTFLYVPASHAVQAVPSAPVNPAIHVHDVLIVLPTAEKVLAGHGEQVSNVAAVVATEKVFAAHGMHVAAPVADLQVPAPQGLHATPSAREYPAKQVHQALFASEKVLFGHAVQLVAAAALYVSAMHVVQTLFTFAPTAVLYVPAVQFVQAAEPLVDFHVPTPQGVHTTPSERVYPARHVHVERLASQKLLSKHEIQFAAPAGE
jgi:hypothetical protein